MIKRKMTDKDMTDFFDDEDNAFGNCQNNDKDSEEDD